MNPLPPLRTVRDATTPASAAATPTQLNTPPPRPAPPGLDAAGLSRQARDFLAELVWLGVVPTDEITRFLTRLGPRTAQLTTRERTLKGADSGPVVVAGKPDESLIVHLIGEKGDPHMPPKGQLSEVETGVIRTWIEGLSAPAAVA